MTQINEASPVLFIHPQLKNEAAFPISIEVYIPLDFDILDTNPDLEQYEQTSWFQDTKDWLKDNSLSPPISPKPEIP